MALAWYNDGFDTNCRVYAEAVFPGQFVLLSSVFVPLIILPHEAFVLICLTAWLNNGNAKHNRVHKKLCEAFLNEILLLRLKKIPCHKFCTLLCRIQSSRSLSAFTYFPVLMYMSARSRQLFSKVSAMPGVHCILLILFRKFLALGVCLSSSNAWATTSNEVSSITYSHRENLTLYPE